MGALSRIAAAEMDVGDWPLGVVSTDRHGAVLTCNAAAESLIAGLGRGCNLFDRLAEHTPALAGAAGALGEGGTLRETLTGPGLGRVGLALMRRGDDGFTVLLTDETAQAEAEAEAGRARARLACIVDGLEHGAVFTLDRDGRVAAWSASAERFAGLPAASAEGMPLAVLLGRWNLEAAAGPLLEVARRHGVGRHEGRRYGQCCGLRWTCLTVRGVRMADGSLDGFVVTVQDGAQELQRADELRRLAETDPLTGLLNRRALHETAAAACRALRDRGLPVAVIAFDLDGFKRLNDTHGHAAGDRALREMAEAARADIRAEDLIGRIGGDEFAIVLPRADAEGALRLAERLRRSLESLPLPYPVTASFGVAASTDPEESFVETLARADCALYVAKQGGRNRALVA